MRRTLFSVHGHNTRADYEEFLNELGIPVLDKKSNGGRIPDHVDYGGWMRKNDPIAFTVGFNDWSREKG